MSKLRTLVDAAPTWIAFAIVAVTAVLGYLETEGLETWAAYAATLLVWLGGAAAIVRRVTPVAKTERGL